MVFNVVLSIIVVTDSMRNTAVNGIKKPNRTNNIVRYSQLAVHIKYPLLLCFYEYYKYLVTNYVVVTCSHTVVNTI